MRERHRQRTVPLCSAWCPDGAVSCDAIQHYTYNSTLNIVQYAVLNSTGVIYLNYSNGWYDRIARHASGAAAVLIDYAATENCTMTSYSVRATTC